MIVNTLASSSPRTKTLKIFITSVFLLACYYSFSQTKEKFKPGVAVLEKQEFKEYDDLKSILFVFQGHSHSINYFLDLEKKIKKAFRKGKSKQIDLAFQYDLTTQNALQHDLEKIPKIRYVKKQYDLISHMYRSDFKMWDEDLLEKRKINYALNAELYSNQQVLLKTFKLNVHCFYTIATQNKKSSRLIHELILE